MKPELQGLHNVAESMHANAAERIRERDAHPEADRVPGALVQFIVPDLLFEPLKNWAELRGLKVFRLPLSDEDIPTYSVGPTTMVLSLREAPSGPKGPSNPPHPGVPGRTGGTE